MVQQMLAVESKLKAQLSEQQSKVKSDDAQGAQAARQEMGPVDNNQQQQVSLLQ